jgi:hypothetical protein
VAGLEHAFSRPPLTLAPPPVLPPAERAGLLAERAALAEDGKRTRPHRDHLEATLAFIRAHWQQ